ncbi:hypothetical protein T265_15735, partial [Opisthorchis viverrini]
MAPMVSSKFSRELIASKLTPLCPSVRGRLNGPSLNRMKRTINLILVRGSVSDGTDGLIEVFPRANCIKIDPSLPERSGPPQRTISKSDETNN